jgi:hypothetical protein
MFTSPVPLMLEGSVIDHSVKAAEGVAARWSKLQP